MTKKPKFKPFEFRRKTNKIIAISVIILYIIFLQFPEFLELGREILLNFSSIDKLGDNNEEVIVYEDKASITIFDVGQGDSILIKIKDIDILIDAGEKSFGDDVVEKLKENNVDDIEYLIATHPHSDHIGGMVEVLKNFEVENFVMPEKEHTTKTFENMVDLVYENDIPVIFPYEGQQLLNEYGATLKVISPNIDNDDNLNNYSICLKFTYGNTSAILTGDAEAKIEKLILESDENLDVDIYKVGHHGSVTSSMEPFVNTLNPQISVISCGVDNDYGHPHKEIIERLENVNSSIYITSELSDIKIVTDGNTIDVLYEQ